MNNNIKTPDKFKEWLLSKNNEDVVGYSCDEQLCPIANFLKEKLNVKVIVFFDYLLINDIKYIIEYDWVKSFILKVDDYYCTNLESAISALIALELL